MEPVAEHDDQKHPSKAEITLQWRLLALQTRRLALFLEGTGQEDAMRRADQFEETAKLLEGKGNSGD